MSEKLQRLIALAHEPSSQRRRDLLREVTDLFLVAPEGHGASEMGLFDDVMSQLAGEMEEAVRAELSQRVASAAAAPRNLLRNLAADASIQVAGPVLTEAASLSDADLLHVTQTRGQEHLRALSQRANVSETVADAIVQHGDDATLGVLLRNDRAQLSRAAQEAAVDRAAANPDLHEAVVGRRSLPTDLLNEMYFVVEARLRNRILERNAELDPATLEAALAAGRKSVAARHGSLPADYAESEKAVQSLRRRNAITPSALAAFLRNGETTKFLVALAELSGVDFHTAGRILERKELDALAIICKAAEFDRSLFLTFAVLILDRDADALGRAREYGELYSSLPRESALRTVRFWRMRRQTGDVAAA